MVMQIDTDINAIPVVEVDTVSLLPGFSPRLAGCVEANVDLLAEVGRPLPPLLVHRATHRVIDGMHRLLAARQRGQSTIAVRYYDGDEDDAFVLAVSANVTHGLPLSLDDRRAAAVRILMSHGQWSNRRIALVTGLSDKTVAAIRVRSDLSGAQGADTRVGLDGRVRPVAVARRGDVTAQLTQGPPAFAQRAAERAGESAVGGAGDSAGRGRRPAGSDLRQSLQALVNDPALRSTDAGRLLLRTLGTVPVIEREIDRLVECVPGHDAASFRILALANAELWRRLAERVAARQVPTAEIPQL